MRYFTVLPILGAVLLAGCTRADYFDTTSSAAYLDGKLVRDKDGCVYSVSIYQRSGGTVFLRNLKELNASTCTEWSSTPQR